jgi:hypothetical protein
MTLSSFPFQHFQQQKSPAQEEADGKKEFECDKTKASGLSVYSNSQQRQAHTEIAGWGYVQKSVSALLSPLLVQKLLERRCVML